MHTITAWLMGSLLTGSLAVAVRSAGFYGFCCLFLKPLTLSWILILHYWVVFLRTLVEVVQTELASESGSRERVGVDDLETAGRCSKMINMQIYD